MVVTLFSVLILLSGLAIIVSVVLQKTDANAGAAFGQTPSIWSKSNTGLDAFLAKITVISSIIFMVSSLVLTSIG